MNEFNLAARLKERVPADLQDASKTPVLKSVTGKPAPIYRTLADLSREDLLVEALYDPAATGGPEAPDDDQLRQEVRWRRAALLREPVIAALARLLSKISGDTFESLSQGDFTPDQLIEKANNFVSGRNGVKILKLPDRIEDHERRLVNLEASLG